ncbi:MAG: CRISPR-associated helicase/endonuclease Cas3 [Ktedonobacteraceae bacterium]
MVDKLRSFQIKVAGHLRAGRSVILQAPTGAGKTRAALDPFLQNLATQDEKLPHTCRYVVPMRVLANQFFHEYDEYVQRIDSYAQTDLAKRYHAIGRAIASVQTGEQREDTLFESALTFCTVDQLLASVLAIPYGLSNSMANINVGAILSSYLIFDEFHLYPLGRDGKSVFGARTTVLQLLRLLKPITPFVLMTATFSSTLLEKLAELLGAEIVNVTDEELVEIAQGRARTFLRSDEPMHAATILADHRQRENKCTLVVCNTVLRAQQLYLALRDAEAHGTRVVLLHSRFTKDDRKRLSNEVEAALGKDQWKDGHYQGPDIIVIATQVVEVGLNISVEVLHTENAPASSLVQRAGRCARFAQQQGRVIVYPLAPGEDGREAFTAPYDKKICDATWDALALFHNQVVGFRAEQKIIDAVHTEEDNNLLTHYEENEHLILDGIFESLRENERGKATELIREISQVQVLIHDDPNEAITKDPWQWESFGLRPTTFTKKGRWDWMWEQVQGRNWVCKQLRSLEENEEQSLSDGADGLDNRRQTRTHYTWDAVTNPTEIRKALMVALPSEVASYDASLGFLFRDDFSDYQPESNYQSRFISKVIDRKNYSSRVTSYQKHIAGLVRAYNRSLRYHIAYVARKLEYEMGLSTGLIEQAILLAIGCHDLGKLDDTWQQWAFKWQMSRYERDRREKYELESNGFCFAKTDNDYTKEDRELQSKVRPKRPHHSCESVMIGKSLIGASLGISKTEGRERMPVLRAICGAIARHHTSQASAYGPFKLTSQAVHAADETLQDIYKQTNWSYDLSRLKLDISKGDDLASASGKSQLTIPTWEQGRDGELETWLYFVIVHALRLADQRASSQL